MLSADDKAGLGVAFNEARWLGAEVDLERRIAEVTLGVLRLPPAGEPREDPRVQVLLRPIGRVWARRTLPGGEVIPLELADLLPTVESFGGCPIYGWEFFDTSLPDLSKTGLSTRVELGNSGLTHSLYLFQAGGLNGNLDLWIWFDELIFQTPQGATVPLAEVIAGGKRWWDALHAGDPRTASACIFPIKGDAG
jgi:hypothetical protein